MIFLVILVYWACLGKIENIFLFNKEKEYLKCEVNLNLTGNIKGFGIMCLC